MNPSAPTTAQIRELIEQVVGKENVLSDAATLTRYACDTSFSAPHLPDMVVKVRLTSEVQGVLKIANAQDMRPRL